MRLLRGALAILPVALKESFPASKPTCEVCLADAEVQQNVVGSRKS